MKEGELHLDRRGMTLNFSAYYMNSFHTGSIALGEGTSDNARTLERKFFFSFLETFGTTGNSVFDFHLFVICGRN